MTNAELNAAAIEWLRAMRWAWWATLAFGHETSAAAMLRAIERWLQPFERAYAVAGLQRGPLRDRLHVHTLFGGVGRDPLTETLLRGSWRHGSLDLKGYSPLKGAVEYLVRQADEIELIGAPPVIHRLRRRR